MTHQGERFSTFVKVRHLQRKATCFFCLTFVFLSRNVKAGGPLLFANNLKNYVQGNKQKKAVLKLFSGERSEQIEPQFWRPEKVRTQKEIEKSNHELKCFVTENNKSKQVRLINFCTGVPTILKIDSRDQLFYFVLDFPQFWILITQGISFP